MSQIENVLHENRRFPPPQDFRAQRASRQRGAATSACTASRSTTPRASGAASRASCPGSSPSTRVLDWSGAPFAQVVRRRQAQRLAPSASTGTSRPRARDKRAIVWEGEPGDTRTLTYAELHREVCRFANALQARAA